MNIKHLNTALISILILSTAALLIGRMYNLKTAGGTGYIQQMHITDQDNNEIRRNQLITTSDDYERLTFTDLFDEEYRALSLFLSKNTEIIITNTDPENLTIKLIQGRVIATGRKPFILEVGDAQLTNSTKLHAVFYSWENRVETSSLEGELSVSQPETKNTQVEVVDFDPDASVEKDFFEWSGLEF